MPCRNQSEWIEASDSDPIALSVSAGAQAGTDKIQAPFRPDPALQPDPSPSPAWCGPALLHFSTTGWASLGKTSMNRNARVQAAGRTSVPLR